MGVMNAFPCNRSSAEEHRNEHRLPRPEVCHVNSFKEVAQIVILQDFVVEKVRGGFDSPASPNQVE